MCACACVTLCIQHIGACESVCTLVMYIMLLANRKCSQLKTFKAMDKNHTFCWDHILGLKW